MRKRYQIGGIKKQRGRWVGMWWVDGKRKSRVLGFVNKLPKSAAREAVNRIVAEENAKRDNGKAWQFGEFVEQVYFPFYTRKWKHSTKANNVNRVNAVTRHQNSAMQPLQPHSISTSRKIDFVRTIRRTKKPPARAGGFVQFANKVLIALL